MSPTTNKPPEKRPGRRFYYIMDNGDGTLDVYLKPETQPMRTPDGIVGYGPNALVVRGVEPFDGLEEDIMERFDDWCTSGTPVYL